MKKPGIKNVLMIIIAIILVGGAFVIAEQRNKQADLIYTNTTISKIDDLKNLENTTDWKKILLTNDISSSSKITDLTKTQEKLSQYDILARDFFARYMELNQMGVSGDKLNQQELIQRSINNIVLAEPKPYTIAQIKTKSDTSTVSLKQYGNEVGGVFKKYIINSRNEGVIAKEAMEAENPELLKELDPIIASYRNIVNGLLKISAPESLKNIHLNIVNAMNGALFIDESFRRSGTDPISGIQAVSQYLVIEKKSTDAMLALKNFLFAAGVKYDTLENGYIFSN